MLIALGPMEPAEDGYKCMKNMEEAVLTGDYGLALQALILNPQIPSGENLKRVLDELLIAHKKIYHNLLTRSLNLKRLE